MALRNRDSGLKLPLRVWDAPTRLFHWAIVLLIATSYVTVHKGWMKLHMLSGYTILTLVLFRVIWGFVGSETSRFSRFLHQAKTLRPAAQMQAARSGHLAAPGSGGQSTGVFPVVHPAEHDRCFVARQGVEGEAAVTVLAVVCP